MPNIMARCNNGPILRLGVTRTITEGDWYVHTVAFVPSSEIIKTYILSIKGAFLFPTLNTVQTHCVAYTCRKYGADKNISMGQRSRTQRPPFCTKLSGSPRCIHTPDLLLVGNAELLPSYSFSIWVKAQGQGHNNIILDHDGPPS